MTAPDRPDSDDASGYSVQPDDPGFAPPTHYAPGIAELQHPRGAVRHLALTYSMPDGYRPLQLDLYVPEKRTGPVPCVVWIHGGAWLFGTRLAPPEYWPAGALFQKAIDAGLAVASIDYRHSREAPYPAQLHDGKAAIRYLRRYAAELGIDPERIGVWGESAGGHLAALLALVDDPALEGTDGVTGESSQLAAGVIFYGVADVDTMPKLADSMPAEWVANLEAQDTGAGAEPIEILLAGAPWPDAEARRQVSPARHARADAPPLLLVHGEADGLVPYAQSVQLAAALREAGAEVELVPVPGADHVFLGTDPVPQLDRGVAYLAERLRPA